MEQHILHPTHFKSGGQLQPIILIKGWLVSAAMGWFDGDSSSDEEKKRKSSKKDKLKHDVSAFFDSNHEQTSRGGHQDGVNIDEDDDPLDAYMKSLGDPSNANTSSSIDYKAKASRLDEENEEEATSHWTSSKNDSKEQDEHGSGNNDTEGDDNFDNAFNNNSYRSSNPQSTMARQALSSTFHKATSQNKGGDEDEKKSTNVDITLKPVQHDQIRYSELNKKIVEGQNTSMGHFWRQRQSVTCHPPTDPISHDILTLSSSDDAVTSLRTTTSDQLLPNSLGEWCRRQGYETMTPVQCQTMSVALNGSNALITASTGSGKTLAYLWPLVLHLFHNDKFHARQGGHQEVDGSNSKGLILVPTRELALQVEKVANGLGKAVLDLASNQRPSLAITGGTSTVDNKSTGGRYQLSQTLFKSDPRILIATPGRLLDVLRALPKKQQNEFSFMSRVTFCVLDEADKLLQMGFANQVTQLLQQLRPDRQCLMTSATMSHRMEQVAYQWLESSTSSQSTNNDGDDKKKKKFVPKASFAHGSHHNLVRISVGTTGRASDHVEQHVIVLPNEESKEQFVLELLPSLVAVGRTLIFVSTRDGCEQLASRIHRHQAQQDPQAPEIQIETLHGDKHQSDRNSALRAFSKGKVPVLIATDVAGRGLDIPHVATVLNYDPAKNLDTHVHRVGRAGRLNKDAVADEESAEGDDNAGGGGGGTKVHNKGTAYTLLVPKQADFARILKSAYEREGRPVSAELAKLASSSWKGGGSSGGGGGGGGRGGGWNGHQKKQRWGLGFSDPSPSSQGFGNRNATANTTSSVSSSSASYYGPAGAGLDGATAPPPPKKKSRWGP